MHETMHVLHIAYLNNSVAFAFYVSGWGYWYLSRLTGQWTGIANRPIKHLAMGTCRCRQTFTLWMDIFDDSINEKTEDTEGVIRIRISKKNRQHNGQKKMYKRTNNDLQNIHIKQKIE